MQYPVQYNNLLFRLAGSFIAGGFIVLHGTGLTIFQAMRKPPFYTALAASVIIALCLSTLIHVITGQLDKRYNWWNDLAYRVVLQGLFGVFIPAVAAFLLAMLYFSAMGVNIFDTGYVLVDFPVIIGMIALFNFYYVVHNMRVTAGKHIPLNLQYQMSNTDSRLKSYETADNAIVADAPEENLGKPSKEDDTYITVISGSQPVTLHVEHDILLFYRNGRHNWIYTFDGDTFIVNKSLAEIEEMYCNDTFFKINRSAIININAIGQYTEGHSRTLKLTLKQEHSDLHKLGLLTVSQTRYSYFKEWFDR